MGASIRSVLANICGARFSTADPCNARVGGTCFQGVTPGVSSWRFCRKLETAPLSRTRRHLVPIIGLFSQGHCHL
ncbi:uncharacterized protein BO96DRAFT_492703 [Aspergillus niger CBS 101883]|uniref:uncharacterized protein n=1 Tax=Aspergillus lacticoffeatus (strain CBS 101883) TaxID=1450533 RepID=UPI000D7EC0FD|nr:uncharacterized protein BO96DRAFT_492703 [Aspergillus niger CBS 101883]PYH50198.1 hypothetical protein BO96DRAFT_492703 [Aspergillus niger CBS 101883]